MLKPAKNYCFMKKLYVVLTCFSILVFTSCMITVTPEIKSVTIVNRSIPTSGTTVETVLTAERKNQDKELSEECIKGLNELLQESTRFQVKRCENVFDAADPTSNSFGAMLSWDFVDSLCKAYETDALLVLEYFDTDFRVVNPGATATQAIGNVLNGQTTSITVTGTGTAVLLPENENRCLREFVPLEQRLAGKFYQSN
jgi:hypothetical protein